MPSWSKADLADANPMRERGRCAGDGWRLSPAGRELATSSRFRVVVPTSEFHYPTTPANRAKARRLVRAVKAGIISFYDCDRWRPATRARWGIHDHNITRYLARLSHLYGEEEALKWFTRVTRVNRGPEAKAPPATEDRLAWLVGPKGGR